MLPFPDDILEPVRPEPISSSKQSSSRNTSSFCSAFPPITLSQFESGEFDDVDFSKGCIEWKAAPSSPPATSSSKRSPSPVKNTLSSALASQLAPKSPKMSPTYRNNYFPYRQNKTEPEDYGSFSGNVERFEETFGAHFNSSQNHHRSGRNDYYEYDHDTLSQRREYDPDQNNFNGHYDLDDEESFGRPISPYHLASSHPTPLVQSQPTANFENVYDNYEQERQGSGLVKRKRVSGYSDSYSANPRKQKAPRSEPVVTPPLAPQNHSPQDLSVIEVREDGYIDTYALSRRIVHELVTYNISQSLFAERIISRSQGTLSDLLKHPKPWGSLKSGRETYRRMYNWVQQPLEVRLAVLGMGSDEMIQAVGVPPPAPSQRKSPQEGPRRPRLVFTDVQKNTLSKIFSQCRHPDRDMIQKIADRLELKVPTVSNFFMNARRRSRGGAVDTVEPTLAVDTDEPTLND